MSHRAYPRLFVRADDDSGDLWDYCCLLAGDLGGLSEIGRRDWGDLEEEEWWGRTTTYSGWNR